MFLDFGRRHRKDYAPHTYSSFRVLKFYNLRDFILTFLSLKKIIFDYIHYNNMKSI